MRSSGPYDDPAPPAMSGEVLPPPTATMEPLFVIPTYSRHDHIRETVRVLFDDSPPRGDPPSLDQIVGRRVVGGFSTFVILMSTATLIVESMPRHYEDTSARMAPWVTLEAFYTAYFTTEILLRLWASDTRASFFLVIYNVFDVLAVLPTYLELIIGSSRSSNTVIDLSLFRVLRVVLVIKIARHVRGLQVVFDALVKSRSLLALGILELFIATTWFATIMYYVEREFAHYDEGMQLWVRDRMLPTGNVREASPYQSIFHTMWWSIVTLTTVGYGDDVPSSWAGRWIAALAMISGVFVLAMPTSIISSNFIMLYRAHESDRAEEVHKNTGLCDRMLSDGLEVEIVSFLEDMRQDDVVPMPVFLGWLELLWDPTSHKTVTMLFLASKTACDVGDSVPLPVQRDRFTRNMKDFVLHIREQAEQRS